MAIVQISKIIHRTGANDDLPQLDIGELGFATDEQRLYIGNDPAIVPPIGPGETTQTEILTTASPIDFSTITGSSNSTLDLNSPENGQLLGINVQSSITTIVNVGGNAGGEITLGNISNVKLNGGVNGYILQTDGAGNLNWTTNGVLTVQIANVSQANPGIVTTQTDHLFGSTAEVTISNVAGMTQLSTGGVSSTNLYFVKRLSNTTFSLYTDSTLTTTVNTGTFFPATANTGYALATISPTGNAVPGGSNTQVQYNDTSGVFGGSSTFTFNKATNLLNVGGNINASNVNANIYGKVNGSIGNDTPNLGTFTSVIALNNANVTANVNSGNINVSGTAQVVGNVDAGNINATTLAGDEVTATGNMTADYFIGNFIVGNIIGNISAPGSNTQVIFNDQGNAGASANFTFNTSINILTVTGNITSTYYTGTLATAAQPNITSVGTLASVTVTGNVSSGNANLGNLATSNYFTGNGIFISNIAGANVSGTVANATYATSAGSTTNAGTVTTNAQPNITSVGTLSSLTVTANISSGNANLGNLATASYFSGNGIFIYNIAGANVSGNVTSAVQSHYANIANSVAGANVSGQVGNALVAGTIYTNAQPNITSVGILTGLTSNGTLTLNADAQITVANTVQSTNMTSGAVRVVGGIASQGNIHGNHIHAFSTMNAGLHLFAGNNAQGSSFQNQIFIGKDTGVQYVQSAMVNASDQGSADWVAYSDSGSDAEGWIDLGFTGSNFSDANFTITKSCDGYLLVHGMENGNGGNLIIATADVDHGDIIFATGGFMESNEKFRFHRDSNTLMPYANLSINLGNSTRYYNNVFANYVTTAGDMSVGGNVIPNANVTYDLGNATNRFKDLWLSGTTIHLGGTSITTDSGGNVSLGNITFSSEGTISSSDIVTTVNEFANPSERKLALTDNNAVILDRAASSRTLVIPDEANINFPIGSKVEIINDSLYGNNLFVECESNVVVKLSVIDNTGALINYTAFPAPDPQEWVRAEIYPAGTITLQKIYSDTWYMTGTNANITYPLSPNT